MWIEVLLSKKWPRCLVAIKILFTICVLIKASMCWSHKTFHYVPVLSLPKLVTQLRLFAPHTYTHFYLFCISKIISFISFSSFFSNSDLKMFTWRQQSVELDGPTKEADAIDESSLNCVSTMSDYEGNNIINNNFLCSLWFLTGFSRMVPIHYINNNNNIIIIAE